MAAETIFAHEPATPDRLAGSPPTGVIKRCLLNGARRLSLVLALPLLPMKHDSIPKRSPVEHRARLVSTVPAFVTLSRGGV